MQDTKCYTIFTCEKGYAYWNSPPVAGCVQSSGRHQNTADNWQWILMGVTFFTGKNRITVNAYLAFLQSCNTVAFIQEDECIFVGWIFPFTHVWHTTKNPLIYLSYPTSDFTATYCSKVQYDTIRFFYRTVKM